MMAGEMERYREHSWITQGEQKTKNPNNSRQKTGKNAHKTGQNKAQTATTNAPNHTVRTLQQVLPEVPQKVQCIVSCDQPPKHLYVNKLTFKIQACQRPWKQRKRPTKPPTPRQKRNQNHPRTQATKTGKTAKKANNKRPQNTGHIDWIIVHNICAGKMKAPCRTLSRPVLSVN